MLMARGGLKIPARIVMIGGRKRLGAEGDPATGNEAEMITRHLVLAAVVALVLPLTAVMAAAGPVEAACLRSDRSAANRSLCDCIGQVADQTLRGSDQRRAATFFRDPDKAHKVWMSKSNADDAFWDRYKAFGAQAEAYCGGS